MTFSNLGRLVGELDGHLEQADGEAPVDLGGKPDPEAVVHLLGVDHGLHDLVAEAEGEVAVLQEQPVAARDRELVGRKREKNPNCFYIY